MELLGRRNLIKWFMASALPIIISFTSNRRSSAEDERSLSLEPTLPSSPHSLPKNKYAFILSRPLKQPALTEESDIEWFEPTTGAVIVGAAQVVGAVLGVISGIDTKNRLKNIENRLRELQEGLERMDSKLTQVLEALADLKILVEKSQSLLVHNTLIGKMKTVSINADKWARNSEGRMRASLFLETLQVDVRSYMEYAYVDWLTIAAVAPIEGELMLFTGSNKTDIKKAFGQYTQYFTNDIFNKNERSFKRLLVTLKKRISEIEEAAKPYPTQPKPYKIFIDRDWNTDYASPCMMDRIYRISGSLLEGYTIGGPYWDLDTQTKDCTKAPRECRRCLERPSSSILFFRDKKTNEVYGLQERGADFQQVTHPIFESLRKLSDEYRYLKAQTSVLEATIQAVDTFEGDFEKYVQTTIDAAPA